MDEQQISKFYRVQRLALSGIFWFCFALLLLAVMSIFLVGVEW